MKPGIFVLSLGCPRNLVDSEILLGSLKEHGFRILNEPKKGSVAIVNTCGFIEDAKRESIDIILELLALKKEGKVSRIILAGCLSQRYPKELLKEIREIDGLFGTNTFIDIPKNLPRIIRGEKIISVDKNPSFLYSHNMPRFLLSPRHSAYVKIQEGCMNFCSYCAIPKIRGSFRSRSEESVLKEITHLKSQGAKEINIVGQDTTLYGIDRYGVSKTASLLKKAALIMKRGWVRLLYTHPAHYTDELIKVVKEEPSVCKYLDLPIQHISDNILNSMNRKVTKKGINDLIEKLRKEIPGVAIRTSILVGFPGETEKEFGELESFIRKIKFDRLGVFIYSREEGTTAYDFPDQVPAKEKKIRFDRIMKIQERISRKTNEMFLRRTIKVLIEEKIKSDKDDTFRHIGRSEYDAPEVDGNVYVDSEKKLKRGQFVKVLINDSLEHDLVGKAQNF